MRGLLLIAIILAGLSGSGCRGWSSDNPPVHPNSNMDTQNKYKPYRESKFFEDGRDMRPNIEGTVPRGKLKEDDRFYRGRVNGELATQFPPEVKLDIATLERGRDRYNIYCAVCHSQVGDGNGLVGRRLVGKKPPSFHDVDPALDVNIRDKSVGHYFDVISNGYSTMKGYKDKLTEADRWAVVAYIRALQVSQDSEGAWITKSALGK